MTNAKQITQHNEKQRLFYNSHTPGYLDFTKNKPYANYLTNKILPFLKPNARVLEVGAGQGRFTFALAEKVKTVEATDFSQHELTLLQMHIKKYKVKNITTKLVDLVSPNDFTKLSTYDAIVCFFVLHHLPKEIIPVVIQNLTKKLRPNGKLLFIEPNNTYPLHAVEMLLMPDMHWEIEKGIYSNYLGIIKKACLKQNYSSIVSEKFGFSPPFLINLFPRVIFIDNLVKRIPFIKNIICPFVLLSAEKA